PAANFNRSEVVRTANAAAGRTEERILRTTIGLIHMTASGARPGRVARVNGYDRNTSKLRLVLNLLPQIMKRPTVQLVALGASSPYPVAYPCQVFQGNSAAGALRFIHQM